MKAYKGFNKDMTCRGFQFEEGKTYTEDKAELCVSGFHACENPLDCFGYYAPSESVYHEVEIEDVSSERSGDTKVVGKAIKIGAKVDIADMVTAAVDYINSHIDGEKKQSNTGDGSAATNTGNCSAATNTGYGSAATNTGNCSAATVSGNGSVAIVTGFASRAKASIGSAICVCERGEFDRKARPLLAIKAAIIDGVNLKPDTWYTLKNGEFVEVE